MDLIIAPVVIAAVVSVMGVLSKEIWFDRKKNKRETKMLAIRLHYVLSKYVMQCADQLSETQTYISGREWDESIHDFCSQTGTYNTQLIDIPIDIEKTDWAGLDIEIVSSILRLSLDIPIYRSYMKSLWDYCGIDDVETTYIEKSSIVGLAVIDIIKKLSDKYNIPYREMYDGDDTLQEMFSSNIKND